MLSAVLLGETEIAPRGLGYGIHPVTGFPGEAGITLNGIDNGHRGDMGGQSQAGQVVPQIETWELKDFRMGGNSQGAWVLPGKERLLGSTVV